jgi:CIC family chloride channel protein
MGYFVPEVLGVGYTHVGNALNGKMVLGFMALLVLLKVIATATSYSSGNAGGIFGPSLFIGAMTGGALGSLAHMALPQYTAESGAYALIGMGTAFAGIIRAPFTSVIMIFEMTRDYTIIVPLMISNLVSFYISSRLQRTPVYEALSHQIGIHLPSAHTRRDASQYRVRDAMRTPEVRLQISMDVRRALQTVRPNGGDAWPIFEGERFEGMISKMELERALSEGRVWLIPTPASEQAPHVHSDHTLDVVLHRMGAAGLKTLPVISRKDVHKLEGIVTIEDVLKVYGL